MTSPPAVTLSYTDAIDAAAQPVFALDASASMTSDTIAFPVAGATLMLWLQTTMTTAGVVIGYAQQPAGNAGRLWVKNPANLQVGIGSVAIAATNLSCNDGGWHHLAVTVAPVNAQTVAVGIYLDGAPVWFAQSALTAAGGIAVSASGTLVLGQGVTGEVNFTGSMSQFVLWNSVLSPAAILSAMQTRPAAGPATVIDWNLSADQSSAHRQGGSFTLSNPPLRFRSNRLLTASWTPSAIAGSTFDVSLLSSDNAYYPMQSGLAASPATWANPAIGIEYAAGVRVVTGSAIGAWSTAATAVPLELGQVAAVLAPTPAPPFNLTWTAVDQATLYAMSFLKGSVPTPPSGSQSGVSVDVTTLVQDLANTYSYTIAATGSGSIGPGSPVAAMPPAPTPTMTFAPVQGTNQLVAAWPVNAATSAWYLSVSRSGSPPTTAAATILAGSSTSYTVPVTATEGQIYTAVLRGLAAGDIGPASTAVSVTVHIFGTPAFGTITSDYNTHVMTVPWTFQSPAGVAAKFDLQLWNSNQSQMIVDLPNAVSPQQITNAAIVQGAVLSLRIRAYADNSFGAWSAWQSVTAQGVPQVTGVSALPDAYGAIAVQWTALPAMTGLAYIVTIYKPDGSTLYTSGPQTGISVKLDQSTTGVQTNTVYTLTVTATATGYAAGTASAAVSVAIGAIQPYPPPQPNYIVDPINTGSGAFSYINEDLVVNGVVPLRFITDYSSDRPLPSENPLFSNLPLGNRWNHSYNSVIKIDSAAGFAYVLWGTGGVDRYTIPAGGTGSYANAGAKLGSSFVKNGNGTYTVGQPDQQTYTFNGSGQLIVITDPIGNVANLSYNNQNQLSTVTDPQSSHTLTLSYSGQSLSNVTDGTHSVSYSVVGNNLMSMTSPLNKQRQFTYVSGATSLIETVIGYTGQTLAKNTYTGGRITLQQDARALAQGLSYGSGFQWSNGTYAMAQSLIAAVTDRMGNTSRFESLTGNGALVNERYQLDSATILVRSYSYDAYANRLSKIEYRGPSVGYQAGMGNATAYSYAPNGQPATTIVTLPGARIYAVSNGYAGGNLTSTAVYEGPSAGYQPGMGNLTTRQYNGDNTLQWVQPPLGNKTQYTYWSGATHGQVKTTTDALGNVFNMTWWPSGLLQNFTDPYGNVTTLTWDGFGRLLTSSNADSAGTVLQTTGYGYNAINQVTSIKLWFPGAGQTAAQAFLTTINYDDNNNRYQVVDSTHVTVTYGYDQNFNLTSVAWPSFQGNTRSTGWSYDRNDFLSGTVWSTASPNVRQTTVNNQIGDCVQFTDPMSAVYTYASAMTPGSGPLALVATTNWPPPSGTTGAATVKTYDPAERVTRIVDRAGIATDIVYATQTDNVTHTQQTVVTRTRPPAVMGGAATVTRTTFDANNRIVAFVDANGKTSRWVYTIETDTNGRFVNVGTMTDPTGRTVAQAFDSFGRLAFTRRAGSGLTRLQSYSYDALGRITQEIETQGADTATTLYSYGYDSASGCLTTSVGRPGGGGGNTVYYFNSRGDCVRTLNPFGQPVASVYAPWGAIADYTDGRGNAFAYTFDKAGRLVTTTPSSGAAVTQTLDAAGNRLTTQSGAAAITRSFDTWNRMLTRTDSAGNRQVGYQYWPEGQLKQLTYPDGKAVNYTLDGLGRIQTVTDWAARVTTYSWLPTDIVTGVTYKNAAATAYAHASYTYDDAGRPTGHAHQAGNLILARAQYVLDGLGQPATATIMAPLAPTLPSPTQTLTYKSGNAIATINGATQDIDNDGDYLGPHGGAPVASYDIYGRVSGFGADQYGYDLDGLRTSATIGGRQTSSVHDIGNWQSPQVERGDPSRAITAAANQPTAYDIMPWHAIEAGANEPTPWAFALDRQLVTYDANGNVTARHVHGVGLIGSENAAGGFAAALTDSAGNVGTLVTDAGLPTQSYVYGPYGDLYAQAGPAGYPFRYNGRDGVLDDGNGLLHMRARGYAPAQFRFLQPDYLTGDPLRPQTLNRYAFAAGNPLQLNDPAGLAVIGIVALGLLAAAGIGLAYIVSFFTGATAGAGGAAGGLGGAAGGAGGSPGGRPPNGRPPNNNPSEGEGSDSEPDSPRDVDQLIPRPTQQGSAYIRPSRLGQVRAQEIEMQRMGSSSTARSNVSSFSNNRPPQIPSASFWN